MSTIWNAKNFLVEARLLREQVPDLDAYPFTIPSIRDFEHLVFDQPVTFLVGENGSGKSTLLEAIAVALHLNPEGGSRNFNFATRASHSGLSQYLRLSRSLRRMRDAYFLRAESFFNVATEIEKLGVGHYYGGKSLHEQSHGESFFALFTQRLSGPGLYLLDEPEAALSPQRQLAFLSRLNDLVTMGSQFLIATHSPILMGYPNATIYQMGDGAPARIEYRETEHYKVTKAFLTRTEQMLAELMQPPEDD